MFFNVKNGDFNVKIVIFSPFCCHLEAKIWKKLEKPIFAMARLTITEYIFEKTILANVCKLIVAADSSNCKQNSTVSTC